MNTPFFLLGAAILFWGWHTGQWMIAVACALLFEAARFVPRRWEFAPEKLNRIGDFCVVLAGLLGAYFYFTLGNPRAVIQFFFWLPFVFMPLALSQAYGTHRDIDLGVIFRGMRRERRRAPARVNIGYVYFCAWIIAASAANRRDAGFELGLLALAAWAMWQVRPRSRPLALWVLLVPLAGAIGYAGHIGLRDLQLWIEGNAPEWIRGEGGADTNPYRADTDIGHIGELKQSDRIVLRVRTAERFNAPLLLHRASYDTYTGLRWLAKNAGFAPIAQESSTGVWPLEALVPGMQGMQALAIVEHTGHVNPVLSLPSGTRRIEGLSASEMKRNALGAVQVEHRPGFVPYRVLFVPGAAAGAVPGPEDLAVPSREAAMLREIVTTLGLKDMGTRDAVGRLERHFADNFGYSTYQPRPREKGSPLAEFLQRTRAGHCEYFASATVLLLRAAGIPARYATGFSVQEWSNLEGAYLARERHIHAWARVWINGLWQDIDTTPASWALTEAGGSSWSSRAVDIWSWLRLRFSELQAREGGTPFVWTALGVVALLWVFWRLFGKPVRGARAARAPIDTITHVPGMDSAFYRVEAYLRQHGWEHTRAETTREWLARIRPHLAQLPQREELSALMHLHYRCRFDPSGLAPAEREQFTARVEAWLARVQ